MLASVKFKALLFAALLVFFIIVRLPMAFVLGFVDRDTGLKWSGVSGTVWHGKITGLRVHQYGLGEAQVRLKFLPLLRGRASVIFDVAGPALRATGQANITRHQELTLRDANIDLDLGGYDIRDAFGQKMFGSVSAMIDVLTVSPTGCRMGDFSYETTALRESLKQFDQDGFDLLGEGRCDNNNLVIPLAGSNGRTKIDIKTVIEPSLTYTAHVAVETPDQQIAQALRTFRFVDQGGRLVLTQRGNFITNP